MRTPLLRRPLFLWILVIPNLLSLIYFGLIAAPVYTSTTSLIVLSPRQSSQSLASLLSGAPSDGSEKGGYILKKYIASWEAFGEVGKRFDLAQSYGLGDFISCYGGFATFFRKNDVALWHYYQGRVRTSVDPKSGIVSLDVHGYRPDFTVALANALLADSVHHMDAMNKQQEQDYVGGAELRAAAIEQTLQKDEAALAAYRARIGIYDPKEQYLSDLSQLNSLALKEVDLKSQYEAIRKATQNNPVAQNLASAIDTIRSKIASTKQGFADVSQKSAVHEHLVVKRDSDITLLNQANAAIQEADGNAQKNKYYLNIISHPSQPQTPELPSRLTWIGAIFLVTIALWGLLR